MRNSQTLNPKPPTRLCDLGCADCLRDAGAERVLEGMAAKGVDGAEALLIRVRA